MEGIYLWSKIIFYLIGRTPSNISYIISTLKGSHISTMAEVHRKQLSPIVQALKG